MKIIVVFGVALAQSVYRLGLGTRGWLVQVKLRPCYIVRIVVVPLPLHLLGTRARHQTPSLSHLSIQVLYVCMYCICNLKTTNNRV